MFTIRSSLGITNENSKGEKKINTFQLTDELNWFNATCSSSPRSECDILYTKHQQWKKVVPKTKIIITIRKDCDAKSLEDVINEGARIFKIDSSMFTLKEYSSLVVKIQNIFTKLNEIPTIIFDLKGPLRNLPLIDKSQQTMNLKEHKIIRITNRKCFSDDHIQIDKLITNVKIGDILSIGNSTIKLEVKKLKRKRPRTKSAEEMKEKISYDIPKSIDDKKTLNVSKNNIESKLDHEISSIWEKSFGDESVYDNEILHCLLNFSSIPVISQLQKLSNDFNEIINKYKSIKAHKDSIGNRNDQCLREFRHKPKQTISTPKVSNEDYAELVCSVKEEGVIRPGQSIEIIKGTQMRFNHSVDSVINIKDMLDIKNVISLGIQIISCRVNNPNNLDDLDQILDKSLINRPIKIIARIETEEAIFNFDSILSKCDGVIIAHGLFPCEISFVDLCLIENYIVEKCKTENKFLFLQSSVNERNHLKIVNNKPLLTELSTIEHAIHNNFDGIIINDDINTEKPNDLAMIKDILFQFERNATMTNPNEVGEKPNLKLNSLNQSIFHSSVKAAKELKAGLIIFYSNNLEYLKDLTKFAPPCTVIFPTPRREEMTLAQLIKGVLPYKMNSSLSLDENTREIIKSCISSCLMHKDDHVVVIVAYENFESSIRNGMYVI